MGAFSFQHWSTSREGSTILLIHGFTGNAESWRRVASYLGNDKTIIAVNLPGHHPTTPNTTEPESFVEAIDDLADTLRSGGQTALHVAGYSLGGRVALGLAVRHPNLVRCATLIGVNPGLRTSEERRARLAMEQGWIDKLEAEGMKSFVSGWEEMPIFATQVDLPSETRDEQRKVRLGHSPEALAKSIRVFGLGAMPNYWPVLADLPMPHSFVAGEKDTKFAAIARKVAIEAPDATAQIVHGAGHNVVLEEPEIVASMIALQCKPRKTVRS